jgi:hypothetical protein
MSDETLTTPVDQAPAVPVDQAPAAAPIADVAAFARALLSEMRTANTPPYATSAAPPAPAPAAPTSPSSPAPVDAAAAVSKYKPGSLAIYEYDHFGRTVYQVMLVIGVYSVPDAAGAVQERLRMLPLGTTHAYADLPTDQVTPADAFDWEAAA